MNEDKDSHLPTGIRFLKNFFSFLITWVMGAYLLYISGFPLYHFVSVYFADDAIRTTGQIQDVKMGPYASTINPVFTFVSKERKQYTVVHGGDFASPFAFEPEETEPVEVLYRQSDPNQAIMLNYYGWMILHIFLVLLGSALVLAPPIMAFEWLFKKKSSSN